LKQLRFPFWTFWHDACSYKNGQPAQTNIKAAEDGQVTNKILKVATKD